MAAPRRVDWTPEARDQLDRIFRFVQLQWSERIADRFLTLVLEFEEIVVRYPNGFQACPLQPSLRIATIHRNVKAIYRVDADRILIITILDTRADNAAWF